MKGKTEKIGSDKWTAKSIQGEIQTWQARLKEVEQQHVEAVKRGEEIDRASENLYLKVLDGDAAATKTLNDLETEGEKVAREGKKLAGMVAKVNDKLGELQSELSMASKEEAASRILQRQAVVGEKMTIVWDAYTSIEKEIKALWKLTREEWADCAVVGIRNVSSRKFTPAWHLVDVMQRLLKMAERDEPLPHGDFLQSLPTLVAQSQTAAQHEINEALKKSRLQIEERKIA